MGWTGGYAGDAVGTLPRKLVSSLADFVGDRYYSDFARTVAVICNLRFIHLRGWLRVLALYSHVSSG